MTALSTAYEYLAALGANDPDAVAALVTHDFVNEHTSSLGSGSVGRDEYRRRLPGFLAQFSGLRYEIVEEIADDRLVALRYRLTATVDGHAIDVPGVMLIEMADGLVARRTDFWDSLTFLRQIGADADQGADR